MVACFMFPDQYPDEPIITELKSKVLAYRLIEGLTKICEDEAKKNLGQQQVIFRAQAHHNISKNFNFAAG